jgi:hypothetical protein
LRWNTLFYDQQDPGDYSTYAQVDYQWELKVLDLSLAAGFTPWRNRMLETDGFDCTLLGVRAGRDFRLGRSLGLHVSLTPQYNPAADKAYFVAGVGFYFPYK